MCRCAAGLAALCRSGGDDSGENAVEGRGRADHPFSVTVSRTKKRWWGLRWSVGLRAGAVGNSPKPSPLPEGEGSSLGRGNGAIPPARSHAFQKGRGGPGGRFVHRRAAPPSPVEEVGAGRRRAGCVSLLQDDFHAAAAQERQRPVVHRWCRPQDLPRQREQAPSASEGATISYAKSAGGAAKPRGNRCCRPWPKASAC